MPKQHKKSHILKHSLDQLKGDNKKEISFTKDISHNIYSTDVLSFHLFLWGT